MKALHRASYHSTASACLVSSCTGRFSAMILMFRCFQLRPSAISVIHPFNFTTPFERSTSVTATDWPQSIHILRVSSVCACSSRNCCKLTSLNCGRIFESFKFNRKFPTSYFPSARAISDGFSCYFRIRIVFKWLIRAFSGHLPPEELLILWDLVRKASASLLSSFEFFVVSGSRFRQLGNRPVASIDHSKFSKREFDASQHFGQHRNGACWFVIHQNLASHSVDVVRLNISIVDIKKMFGFCSNKFCCLHS